MHVVGSVAELLHEQCEAWLQAEATKLLRGIAARNDDHLKGHDR